MIGVRERLDNAVVGDRQRLVSPGNGRADEILHIGHTVHIAHLRVAVQLHPFLGAGVHPPHPEIRDLLDAHHGTDGQLTVKFINGGDTLQLNEATLLQSTQNVT